MSAPFTTKSVCGNRTEEQHTSSGAHRAAAIDLQISPASIHLQVHTDPVTHGAVYSCVEVVIDASALLNDSFKRTRQCSCTSRPRGLFSFTTVLTWMMVAARSALRPQCNTERRVPGTNPSYSVVHSSQAVSSLICHSQQDAMCRREACSGLYQQGPVVG
jgi:hypothetical protein